MKVFLKKSVEVAAKIVVIATLVMVVGWAIGALWLRYTKPALPVTPSVPPAPADDWLEIKISHDGKLISVVRSEGWVQNPQEFGRPQLADIIDRLEKVLPRVEVPPSPSETSAPSVPSIPIPNRPDCYGNHRHGDSGPAEGLIPIPLIPVLPLPRIYEGEPVPPPMEEPTESPIGPPIILEGRPGGRSPARLTPYPPRLVVPRPYIRCDGPYYSYPGIRW